jgi:hypothetical protein
MTCGGRRRSRGAWFLCARARMPRPISKWANCGTVPYLPYPAPRAIYISVKNLGEITCNDAARAITSGYPRP